MGNLLVLLSFASFIAIFYFWLKKHDKKWIIISIIATFVFGGLYSLTPEYKQEQVKEAQEQKEKNARAKKEKQEQEKKKELAAKKEKQKQKQKQEQEKELVAKKEKQERQRKLADKKKKEKQEKQRKLVAQKKKQEEQKKLVSKKRNKKKSSNNKETSKSTLLKRAKKLKYGMSVKQVKKIMKVKPISEEKDEAGNVSLTYGKDIVGLGFEKDSKLIIGTSGAPQITKQGEKAAAKKKEKRENYNNKLKGFAQSFGIKPSEEIQRMPSVYKTVEDEDNLLILWNPGEGLPILLRKDDTTTNVTTVYIYNKKGDNPEGKLLYTGRTIVQKNKRPVIY